MKKISLTIIVLALGLISWKTKRVEAAPLNKNVNQEHYLLSDLKVGMDTIKKVEVRLKLVPGAGDVAKVKLLSVMDKDGNVIIKKFVPNNTKGLLKFDVPEGLDSLKVQYGGVNRNIELVNGVAVFNFREGIK